MLGSAVEPVTMATRPVNRWAPPAKGAIRSVDPILLILSDGVDQVPMQPGRLLSAAPARSEFRMTTGS